MVPAIKELLRLACLPTVSVWQVN